MTDFDVTVDRQRYIGGSDIPAIMGISTFKTRFELLLEKAGLKEVEFTGNRYTVFGQKLEPVIRNYINQNQTVPFVPNKNTIGDVRCHTDGYNGECVLEIKTTSHIYDTVAEYKVYLVQLLKYMEVNKVDRGLLAVYERPEDFDLLFDPERLHLYDVLMADNLDLLAEINKELDKFRHDLERLKKNPLLTEEDFLEDQQLVVLSNKVLAFESQLAALKAIEQQCKDAKVELYEAMERHGVKSWTTPNGTKISMVAGTPVYTETVTEFDQAAFKAEQPEMYAQYLHEVQKKKGGRGGYVKITLPK